MPLRHRRAIAAAAAAGALLAAAVADVLASGDPTTSAVGARAGHDAQAALGRRPVPLPRFIYAPYFETWHTESLPSVAQKSGARYLTLAFLQTTKKGSCTLAWNGKQLVQPGGRYSTQIAELRHAGGDVIPSFGGFGADHDDTEIADSCTSVAKIASAYENVVTTYGVTRLDMDIEDKSLTRKAGIARRSAAIALLQKWAARTHRRVQVAFTLSVEPGGLSDSGLAVLKSAISHGVRVDAVNIMAFDYYNAKTDSDMGSEAIEALTSTHRQLMRLFPHVPAQRLWYLEGITLMPGIDDFPGKTEVTYLSEVQALLSYVQRHPIQAFSIWSVQRDNGGCPGAGSSGTCSGITQPRWAFSHLLDSYSRG